MPSTKQNPLEIGRLIEANNILGKALKSIYGDTPVDCKAIDLHEEINVFLAANQTPNQPTAPLPLPAAVFYGVKRREIKDDSELIAPLPTRAAVFHGVKRREIKDDSELIDPLPTRAAVFHGVKRREIEERDFASFCLHDDAALDEILQRPEKTDKFTPKLKNKPQIIADAQEACINGMKITDEMLNNVISLINEITKFENHPLSEGLEDYHTLLDKMNLLASQQKSDKEKALEPTYEQYLNTELDHRF